MNFIIINVNDTTTTASIPNKHEKFRRTYK
jgi:hypothetical protein